MHRSHHIETLLVAMRLDAGGTVVARVILRDGKVAEFRVAHDNERDREILRELFRAASPESLYFRFFHVVREVSESMIDSLVLDDPRDSQTLLCIAGDQCLGMGNYIRETDTKAEVAFLVSDRAQGKGIGTLLLENLAEIALAHGFRKFEANVLGDNYKMLKVFTSSGFVIKSKQDSGTSRLTLPLTHTERSRSLYDMREKLATAASLVPLFRPRTIAVVGASRDPKRLGHVVLRHLLDGQFAGTVYPVNPSAHSVAAIKAYPSLCDVPEPIDLVVVVTPAEQVLSVVEDCVRIGAGGVLITSAGFAEKDELARQIQEQIVERLRETGCRLIGPNCLGIINTQSDIQMNASFAPDMPVAGGVAVASQSGALGIAILDYASRIGVGISSFVSMGNKADVSGNDLLQYWEDDVDAKMIALYLESFGNPRKFSRITRRITREKPILAIKSARSSVSMSVSEAKPVAIPASDILVEALFRQTGIIRVDSFKELFDTMALLAFSPLPAGCRVAIVTNTAGGAVMTVDALTEKQLEFVQPIVDLGSEALAEGYRMVLPAVLRDPEVDAVVVLFIPVGLADEAEVMNAISEAIQEVASDETLEPRDGGTGSRRKPVVANFLTTGNYLVRYIEAGEQRVPIYPFPDQAVEALAKVADYAEYIRKPKGRIPDLEGADSDLAASLIRQQNVKGSLTDDAAMEVFHALGIHSNCEYAPSGDGHTPRLTVFVESDPLFGPLIGLHLWGQPGCEPHRSLRSGSWARGSCLRITPLTDLDAHEMATTILGDDQEGEPVRTILEDLLLRLSYMVEDIPELTQVSIPDLSIHAQGTCFMTGAEIVYSPNGGV